MPLEVIPMRTFITSESENRKYSGTLREYLNYNIVDFTLSMNLELKGKIFEFVGMKKRIINCNKVEGFLTRGNES